MGTFLRDVMKLNMESTNFRVFGPDENSSNRWQDLFEVTDRASTAETQPCDDHVSPDGRVMEMLSEHVPGLAGGLSPDRPSWSVLLLRGVHSHHRLDVQPACQMAEGLQPHPVAASDRFAELSACPPTCGGRTTTDSAIRIPGFIDHVVNKKAEISGSICRPTRTPCCPSPTIVCAAAITSMSLSQANSRRRSGWLWTRRSNTAPPESASGSGRATIRDSDPDVVMACCGDVPTLETLAAVDLLRRHRPSLKIRVINVVDLMTLQPPSEHPHGLVR